jgi:hypothetical protein
VECEHHPAFIAVVLFPPPGIGDALVGIFVKPMVQSMIRHRDRKPILIHGLGKPTRHGPRAQHAILFKPQIKMRTRLAVVMKHKGRMDLRHGISVVRFRSVSRHGVSIETPRAAAGRCYRAL